MSGPYEGLRVIDLANAMPGSYAAMMLAELGADVVKVEPPSGHPMRGQPSFHVFNRGKRSVVADVSTMPGRRLVFDLLAKADVAIADYLPAEEKQLDLSYSAMALRNPRLIYCAVPPMGSVGPLADTPRHDALIAAHAGMMGAIFSFRSRPVYMLNPMASYGAAFLATSAVGAALHVRHQTGRGQRVEVSWLAGAMMMLDSKVVTSEPFQPSKTDGDPAPHLRMYECGSGGWLSLSAGSETFFNKLCLAVDRADFVGDPRFDGALFGATPEVRQFLKDALTAAFQTRSRDEWLKRLREYDVPCAPVLTRQEILDHPQVIHNGMRVEVEDPELGRTIQAAPPLRMSLSPPTIKGPAPRLGEHNAEVRAALRKVITPNGDGELAPNLPLAGIRVIDLGTFAAGPVVAKLLADMGADVIKVETLAGDAYRILAYAFVASNRGKRGIAIDTVSQDGREIVYRLVRGADIVISNIRPAVAQRMGLHYESLRKVNPKIIMYSGGGIGNSGPLANEPAFAHTIHAMSGLCQAQGGKGQPVQFNVIFCDYATALVGAVGVLAALAYRDRTGHGQLVESNLCNGALAMQAGDFIFYDGKPPAPEGGADLLGLSALHRLYQASDDWLMLIVETAEQWRALTRVIGREDLLERYPLVTALAAPREGELASGLALAFSTRPRAAWLDALHDAGVPAAAVLTYADTHRDPQTVAERLFSCDEEPPWGSMWVSGGHAKFSDCPGVLRRHCPAKGEHSVEILEELGLSAGDIARLREQKIVP